MGVVVGGEGAPAPWGWRAEGSEMLEEWSLRDQGTQKTQPIDQERKVHGPSAPPQALGRKRGTQCCVSPFLCFSFRWERLLVLALPLQFPFFQYLIQNYKCSQSGPGNVNLGAS